MATEEKWLPVCMDEYSSRYEVRTLGNIRSIRTERILKQDINNGYHRVALARTGMKHNSEHFMVHRIVAATYIENYDETKIHVNHIDGNKSNNCVTNLEWVTVQENNKLAIKTGLRKQRGTPIIIIDGNDDIFEYATQAAAQRDAKIGENTILRALANGTKPFGWTIKYKNNAYRNEQIDLTDFEDIEDFPGYKINRQGKVYSMSSKKFVKSRLTNNGYPILNMRKDKKNITKFIHTLVATQFIPNPNKHSVVNHIDHNKTNYAIENLEWCSHKENTAKYLQRKKLLSVLSPSSDTLDGSGENSEVEEKSD